MEGKPKTGCEEPGKKEGQRPRQQSQNPGFGVSGEDCFFGFKEASAKEYTRSNVHHSTKSPANCRVWIPEYILKFASAETPRRVFVCTGPQRSHGDCCFATTGSQTQPSAWSRECGGKEAWWGAVIKALSQIANQLVKPKRETYLPCSTGPFLVSPRILPRRRRIQAL